MQTQLKSFTCCLLWQEVQPAVPAAPAVPLKTVPCRFFELGHCRRGAECAYAHGIEELREALKRSEEWFCFVDPKYSPSKVLQYLLKAPAHWLAFLTFLNKITFLSVFNLPVPICANLQKSRLACTKRRCASSSRPRIALAAPVALLRTVKRSCCPSRCQAPVFSSSKYMSVTIARV